MTIDQVRKIITGSSGHGLDCVLSLPVDSNAGCVAPKKDIRHIFLFDHAATMDPKYDGVGVSASLRQLWCTATT